MSTTLQNIIEEFSAEDQMFIQHKANALAGEMIQHSDSLAAVRTAFVKTQDEVACVLNVKQNAIAQLEKRSDLLISTLRKYVEAMGGELAVTIRTGAGTVIMLDSFSSISKASAPALAHAPATTRKKTTGATARSKTGRAKSAAS